MARIKLGLQDLLYLGNLDARRDWGHARDFVRAMWLMLQQDEPDDYVIATGENHSVREFVEKAFSHIDVKIRWQGSGVHETGKDAATGKTLILVEIDPRYFRPTEVDFLLGDPSKAGDQLGWRAQVSFDEIIKEMVQEDLREAEKDKFCKREGFKVYSHSE